MNISVQQLVAALAAEAALANREVEKVVRDSSRKVQDDGRRNARATAGRVARLYPATITHEVRNQGTRIEGEIGPEARGQGRLGHILELGTTYAGVHNPPHRDLGRALDEEEPRFLAAMREIGPFR